MTRPPDFDDLVGKELPPGERERLRRAHELLAEAGPAPELAPWLEQAPTPWVTRSETTRREPRDSPQRWRLILLAAAIALTGFVVGTFVSGGSTGTSFKATRVVELRGSSADPRALAVIRIGKRDAGGNWPMVLEVGGLHAQPPDGYYTLALVRNGKPEVPCGTFRVEQDLSRSTTVRLNAPYDLREFHGWVVTEFEPGGSHDISKQPVVLRS